MNNSGVQIRIGDLLYAMGKRWRLMLALTILGMGTGAAMAAISYLRGSSRNYEIACSFAVTAQVMNGNFTSNNETITTGDFYLAEDMVDAVGYVMKSERVLTEAISAAGIRDASPRDVARSMTLSRYNDTQIIEVTLDWKNAEEGVSLMAAVLEVSRTVLPETLKVGSVAVIDEPAAGRLLGAASFYLMIGVLAGVGLLAGIGVALLDLLMRPTLINTKDVGEILNMETIGIIPKGEETAGRRGAPSGGRHGAAVEQNFAASAYIIRNLLGSKKKHHCFYITSTMDGEGKTTAAANIALRLAEMEHRVLLVDLDMRAPSLGSLFLQAPDYSHSLNALYKGEATPEEAIVNVDGFLDVLPLILEHNAVTLDGTLFSFLETMKERYEYVIIDSSPVGQVSDVLSLNQVADAALFMIGYDQATLADIENAIEKLEKSGIRMLGSIVNGQPVSAARSRSEAEAAVAVEKARETRQREAAMGGFSKEYRPEENRKASYRDPLAGLDETAPEPEGAAAISDEDAVDALIRMGMDGSWKGPEAGGKQTDERSDTDRKEPNL